MGVIEHSGAAASLIVPIAISSIILYGISRIVYNVYFHPLSKYPGPASAAASQLPIAWQTYHGTLSHWLHDLHEYYKADVVRISPHELSFIDPAAWKDIYIHQKGREHFQKDLVVYANFSNIVTAPDDDHRRIRRLLNHAFSDKALREQEALLQGHIRKLIEKLTASPEGGKIDLNQTSMFLIFDIISDLSFGTSTNCQESPTYHPWVSSLLDNIRLVVFSSVAKRFAPFESILSPLIVPKTAQDARQNHDNWAAEQTIRRLNTESSRPDFLSYVVKHNQDPEKGGMTEKEIFSNMAAFMAAGGETTAGVIAVTMYLLMKHPAHHERAKKEIRALFNTTEEITLQKIIDGAPFLQALIDETFRVYPPALGGQPRVAPPAGEFVGKHWVPGGTHVQTPQYACNHSSRFFSRPNEYLPERWMGGKEFEAEQRDIVQPFGTGSRNCIGKNLAVAEIRLALAHLLFAIDFDMVEDTNKDWMNQKAWMTWTRSPLVVGFKAAGK